MKIDQINIYKILIPFSVNFSHSLKKGYSATFANNIVTEVIAEQGEIRGYGEGAPRRYVTKESPESGTKHVSHFVQKDSFPWELNDVSQIWNFVDSLPNGKTHNSAICALEMSLLDALGKSQNRYIIEYFPKGFYTNKVYYGAGIPLDNKQTIMEICRLIKKMKIKRVKLKMGKNFTQNKETIETVSSVLEDDYDIKIDINGVWDRELAFKHIPLIKAYKVKVVEQPMMPDDPDIAEFARAMRNYSIVLMADESACSLRDIERIAKEGHYKMVKVR